MFAPFRAVVVSVDSALLKRKAAAVVVEFISEATPGRLAFGTDPFLSSDYGRISDGAKLDPLNENIRAIVESGPAKVVQDGGGSQSGCFAPTVLQIKNKFKSYGFEAPTKTSAATLVAPFTASKVKAVDSLAPSASTLDSVAHPFEGCLADRGIDHDDGHNRYGLQWL
ncbi:hypothetical protein MVLG_07176 [Microbotryum lychnidis-dioicae p1A1 Lamole]|uniref:Uncharacterized protein n=2 Tax=Microbotryum TaxID=34416 RepID=U5HJJ4_USTV1|nr:hypothetical protein MVLG_07176 [Microbotryum lychnidis-dioicae p1A1 Lamole]SGY28857.1 BQ5605_C002g00973 [Microbotryum silenes-dioicae]|eukprot:KDE02255.1 hypothetical protein MVLG_07176 [Microbotryum lychnidis-dioicae p1A1 Lamole]